MPVLPELERGERGHDPTEGPMPDAKVILVGVVKNERRGDEPCPTRKLRDLFPPAQTDNFELREQEHCQPCQRGIQYDAGDRSLVVKPWGETNRKAQPKAHAVFPSAVSFSTSLIAMRDRSLRRPKDIRIDMSLHASKG